jgi:hypothetical protein
MPGPDSPDGGTLAMSPAIAWALPQRVFAWEMGRFAARPLAARSDDAHAMGRRQGFASPVAAFGLLALLALISLAWCAAGGVEGVPRRRMPLLLCAMALGFEGLAGCHHSNGTISRPGTPTGTTTMLVTGNALDASGNSLQASRSLQFIVQVSPR